MLEALLKRVDGLEKKLRDEKAKSPNGAADTAPDAETIVVSEDPKPKRPHLDTSNVANETAVYSPTPIR